MFFTRLPLLVSSLQMYKYPPNHFFNSNQSPNPKKMAAMPVSKSVQSNGNQFSSIEFPNLDLQLCSPHFDSFRTKSIIFAAFGFSNLMLCCVNCVVPLGRGLSLQLQLQRFRRVLLQSVLPHQHVHTYEVQLYGFNLKAGKTRQASPPAPYLLASLVIVDGQTQTHRQALQVLTRVRTCTHQVNI